MSIHFIFDADTALQRVGFLDLPSQKHYEEAVVQNFTYILTKCQKVLGCDYPSNLWFCFTDSQRPRYRSKYDKVEVYKEARASTKKKEVKKPKFMAPMLEALLYWSNANLIADIIMDDATECEADDRVATIAANCRKSGDDYVVLGVDKDLKQIEGWHFNFIKSTASYITEEEAYRFIYWQMLVGDVSDSIGGISGIGPVKADKLLLRGTDYNTIVQDIYFEYYGPKEGSALFSERFSKLLLIDDLESYEAEI